MFLLRLPIFPSLLASGPRRESTSNEFRSIPSSREPAGSRSLSQLRKSNEVKQTGREHSKFQNCSEHSFHRTPFELVLKQALHHHLFVTSPWSESQQLPMHPSSSAMTVKSSSHWELGQWPSKLVAQIWGESPYDTICMVHMVITFSSESSVSSSLLDNACSYAQTCLTNKTLPTDRVSRNSVVVASIYVLYETFLIGCFQKISSSVPSHAFCPFQKVAALRLFATQRASVITGWANGNGDAHCIQIGHALSSISLCTAHINKEENKMQ